MYAFERIILLLGRNVAAATNGTVNSGWTFLTNTENAMAFIPTANTVKITLEFNLHGELCVNVYYATLSSPITTVNLTQIATIVKDWWIASAADFLSQDLTLTKVVAMDVSVEDGFQVTMTEDLPAPGGITTASLANQVALVVSKHTLFTGRSSRGRAYIPGLAAASVSSNAVSATVQVGLIAAHGQLQTDLFAVPANLVVVSFWDNGVQRTAGRPRGIASYSANNRVDTQRRRLPRTAT